MSLQKKDFAQIQLKRRRCEARGLFILSHWPGLSGILDLVIARTATRTRAGAPSSQSFFENRARVLESRWPRRDMRAVMKRGRLTRQRTREVT